MDPGPARIRFGQARAALTAEAAQRARETGDSHALLERLDRDNGDLICGRLSPSEATVFLLGACMGNPVAPYEIRFDEKHEQRALEDLAQDLGFPGARAHAVLAAEQAGAEGSWLERETWHKKASARQPAPRRSSPRRGGWSSRRRPAGLAGGAGIGRGRSGSTGPGWDGRRARNRRTRRRSRRGAAIARGLHERQCRGGGGDRSIALHAGLRSPSTGCTRRSSGHAYGSR